MTCFFSLSSPVKLTLMGVCLFSLIPTLLAQYPVSAWTQWLYLLGLIVLIGYFSLYLSTEPPFFFRLIIILNGLLFLSVAVGFFYRLSLSLPVDKNTFVGFSNPRFISQVQVWLYMPLAYLILTYWPRHRRGGYGLFFVLAVSFSLCFTLDARGALLAVNFGFLCMTIVDRAHRKQWFKMWFTGLTAGLAISLAFFNPLPSYILDIPYEDLQVRTSSSGRIALWLESLESLSFWGKGGGFFVCQPFDFGRPHNAVLNIWIHWGVLSLLSCFALVWLLIKKIWCCRSVRTKALGVNLLVGLSYSLVSGVLDSALSQFTAVLSTAMFWASLSRSEYQSSRFRAARHSVLMVVMLLVLVAVSYRAYLRIEQYPIEVSNDQIKELRFKTQFWGGYNCIESPNQP
ncbi:O-antigen ligase family protein [Vibrio olivae]|uniref:O-antigen ligase family protein n=1 Tax=Vibrio olivae TaxID=1243002 RepID=A0ABV5HK33_9VIBR